MRRYINKIAAAGEYREEKSLEISVEEQDGRLAIEEEELGRLDDALFEIAEVRDTE